MIYICFSALSTYDVQKRFKESQWTVVMVEWSQAICHSLLAASHHRLSLNIIPGMWKS